ncbi:MAG: hypothetical protein IT158_01300 [Bryobacterales bacterium]|nr:hypothetical protein [Bryobacterales bacterium]
MRNVVLYKHGVGYFERAGQLGPGESARLEFKAAEMNDVLKSLTVEEKGGGRITGLRYDSAEPFERRQGDFPFKIGEAQPLSTVLDQLKGRRVELKMGSQSVSGTIVGARVVPGGENRPEQQQVTLLLDSGEVRVFDLGTVTALRFPDPVLEAQFKDYLAALAASSSKESRSVYIDSTDARAREIVLGYVIPTPVWKSSYRLIFGQGDSAVLEGWAIVDNTTGEDWTKVRLALVSGRPISFVSPLFEPRYVERPVAGLPEDRARGPIVHAGALESAKEADTAAEGAGGVVGGVIGGVAGGRFRTMAAPPPPPPSAKAPSRAQLASSVGPAAATREVGELFEYQIAAPVTVRKGESAMLPFIQQKIEARKLLIYADQSTENPMNAAELTNATGKTLDGGPITVFDAGAYGGEALMATVKSGDRRLISYAVDLGTRISTQFDSRADMVREIHLRRGVLTTRSAAVETRMYTIRNVDQKAKTLIVEHPVRPQFTLLDQKPWETTPAAYRFQVKLAPGATEKFPVREERLFETTFAVVDMTPDVLATYVQNKALSPAGRKQLEQILAQKRVLAETEAEIRSTETQFNDLTRDQERLRKNIESLNRVSGQQTQVQDYARRLADQEARLASLRDRIAELQKKRDALRRDLADLIEKADF